MFEVKDNKEIGAYIEKLIVDKFPNKRQFSIAYIENKLGKPAIKSIRSLKEREQQFR